MTRDQVYELKQNLTEIADVVAAALAKRLNPAEDELTTREAYSQFGRRWVAKQVRLGRIQGRRRGPHALSPVVFSRAELVALKEAEQMARCEAVWRERKTERS